MKGCRSRGRSQLTFKDQIGFNWTEGGVKFSKLVYMHVKSNESLGSKRGLQMS